MKSPLVTIDSKETVLKVATLMKSHDIGSVIVEVDGRLAGLITEKDLVWRVFAEEKNPKEVTAGEIMSSPLISADIDATLSQMARAMAKNKIRRLIITKQNEPVGVVSERDIVRVAPEQIELLSEYLRILK